MLLTNTANIANILYCQTVLITWGDHEQGNKKVAFLAVAAPYPGAGNSSLEFLSRVVLGPVQASVVLALRAVYGIHGHRFVRDHTPYFLGHCIQVNSAQLSGKVCSE